ncbi:MAG TPA: hypothetical protein VHR66_22355 [Gemmataceae bacterium]|jgi:hypothetical protein|nr:hypothetical protein [Gemmataceae bacterium]
MFVTTVALLSVTLAAPAYRDRKDSPATLERKLVGEWTKGGACIGYITFQADGTFERKHYSPGNNTTKGKWKMRWDVVPPVLVLRCEEADREDLVGQTLELMITRLDDDELHFESGRHSAGKFTHPKK